MTIVLLGIGTGGLSNSVPVVVPPVQNEGVVRDVVVTTLSGKRDPYFTRTSGGDGTFSQSQIIRRVEWPSLDSAVLLSRHPAQWFRGSCSLAITAS